MPSKKYKNREDFNKYIHSETVKYQRQYGFEMGTGEHATWNNEIGWNKSQRLLQTQTLRYGFEPVYVLSRT
jgi:hypothetical protein